MGDGSVTVYNVSEETMSGKDGTMDGKESEAHDTSTNESERNASIFCSVYIGEAAAASLPSS